MHYLKKWHCSSDFGFFGCVAQEIIFGGYLSLAILKQQQFSYFTSISVILEHQHSLYINIGLLKKVNTTNLVPHETGVESLKLKKLKFKNP